MHSRDRSRSLANRYAEELMKPRVITGGVSVQGEESATTPAIDQKRLEAQANLKGTVGGVQGILEIQRSVSTGITQRDAAIALLVEIYGFNNEQASNIIGNPTPIQDIANENVSVNTTI